MGYLPELLGQDGKGSATGEFPDCSAFMLAPVIFYRRASWLILTSSHSENGLEQHFGDYSQ